MSEAMKINHFHSHFREAPQTLRNTSVSYKRAFEDTLIILRRKYVRPQSEATAKHYWHILTFDPNTKPLSDFLEEPNYCAERVFRPPAEQMIDSLLYAALPHI